MNAKLRLVFYRLSMPLYRTWEVTLKREPLPLPHSLSLVSLRNVFPVAPLFPFRYALQSHTFLRLFPSSLSAASVRFAPLRPLSGWSPETANTWYAGDKACPAESISRLGIVEDVQDARLRWGGVGGRCDDRPTVPLL